ncbi:MAG: AraC family transcriptional regulator [Alphaproteobacteria bacterium]|nr:AraC family transcriptional regulator [Alphaproteobacteria bacterium]
MRNTDIISDVFSTLRISGDLYFRADLRGDFSIEIPEEHRCIRFHLVRQGRCHVTVPNSPTSKIQEGDLAIIPNGVKQTLASNPESIGKTLAEILAEGDLADGVLTYGNGDRQTRLLCGFCSFDQSVDHPVLANLPNLIIVRPADLGREPWTAAAMRLLALEADLDTQGTSGILARMLEILFIQTVRQMTSHHGGSGNGFIAALSDIHLTKALNAIHTRLDEPWTVASLAAEAGMSRARFARKFASGVGIPPVDYLTRWRLIKARSLLSHSALDMSEIANRCGYASTPSFSRRFKQTYGIGPGSYRRSKIAP